MRVLALPLLLLGLPAVVEAQSYTNNYGIWHYTSTNGTITITGYTGPRVAVSIPSGINGLPVSSIGDRAFCESFLAAVTIPNSVTSIGAGAFEYCTSLTSFTIPNSVTGIGAWAFGDCWGLTSVTIGTSVTSIGPSAFNECDSLTSVSIPNSVASIGGGAFEYCALTNVIIGTGVTSIGDQAFAGCTSLTNITVDTRNSAYSSVGGVLFNKSLTTLVQYPGGIAGSYAIPNGITSIGSYAFLEGFSLTSVTIPDSVTSIGEGAFYCTLSNPCSIYFEGNAPSLGGTNVFFFANNATVYYLPGTTGWDQWVSPPPAVLWNPQVQPGSFGVRSNQLGFTITGSSNLVVVIEACTNLANPTWSPVQTNTLNGNSLYFTDPNWTNYSSRFYRVTWP